MKTVVIEQDIHLNANCLKSFILILSLKTYVLFSLLRTLLPSVTSSQSLRSASISD